MRLQTGLSGAHSSPSWSPDGKRIAFAFGESGRSRIYVFNLAASRRTLLVSHGTEPAWTRDGSTIAYRVDCGIKLATPSGREATPISGPFRCRAMGIPGTPVWSPDGKKIAIGTRSGGIHVMEADGTDLSRITKKSAAGATRLGRPSWRRVAHHRDSKG